MPLAQIESVWDKAEQSPVQDILNSTHAAPALNQMLQEARNDPAIWHAHILPLHQRLRQQMGLKAAPPPPKAQSSRILYYHSDHLGTPRELTNRHGNIVWAATYKAWGATQSIDYPPILQTVQNGNTVQEQWIEQNRYDRPIQNLRFQGQYFDQETGLHYNRFRYYDPDIGRFISQDPIGLYGGDNLYQYAPNPTGWIDPWGWSCCKRNLPGPNIGHHKNSFTNSIARNRQVDGSEIFLRYHGINNRLGHRFSYVTNKKYSSEKELRADLAILKAWDVDITHVTSFRPQRGTWISEGNARWQSAGTERLPGGGYQGLIGSNDLPKSSILRTDRVRFNEN